MNLQPIILEKGITLDVFKTSLFKESNRYYCVIITSLNCPVCDLEKETISPLLKELNASLMLYELSAQNEENKSFALNEVKIHKVPSLLLFFNSEFKIFEGFVSIENIRSFYHLSELNSCKYCPKGYKNRKNKIYCRKFKDYVCEEDSCYA